MTDPSVYATLNRITFAPTGWSLGAGTYFISVAGAGYSALSIPTFSLTDAANPVAPTAYSYQSNSGSTYIAAYRRVSGTEVPEPSVLALFGQHMTAR